MSRLNFNLIYEDTFIITFLLIALAALSFYFLTPDHLSESQGRLTNLQVGGRLNRDN